MAFLIAGTRHAWQSRPSAPEPCRRPRKTLASKKRSALLTTLFAHTYRIVNKARVDYVAGVTKHSPVRRKRRTTEDARTQILDAAERRLVASGPKGIRLQSGDSVFPRPAFMAIPVTLRADLSCECALMWHAFISLRYVGAWLSTRWGLFLVVAGLALGTSPGCGDDKTDTAFEPTGVATPDASTPSAPADAAGIIGHDAAIASGFDAGDVRPVADSGTSALDAGTASTTDAGTGSAADASSTSSDAAATTDGASNEPPDADAAKDAATTTEHDAAATTPDGGRDVNGPCKDLYLLCFDFIDMWINAECQTCNSGQGCQGCAIPFAY